MRIFKKEKGLTLIEILLSLSLGALLLISAAFATAISVDSYNQRGRSEELLQHARLAMFRMSTELRYATKLTEATSVTHSYLRFETTNLVDSDPGVEEVEFYRLNGNPVLYRRIDGIGFGSPLAGDAYEYFTVVESFEITPMKLSPGGSVVPLGGSPLAEAVAVQLELTMKDRDLGNTVTVNTMVKFRNR